MGEETDGAENLLSMLNNVDADKVGNVLKEFEKYEKILDKITGMIMRLNRIGVLPATIRILSNNNPDIDKPLPQQNPLAIDAATPSHLLLYKELNTQPETVITDMFKASVIEEAKQKKGKPKK